MRMILKTEFKGSICLDDEEFRGVVAEGTIRGITLKMMPEPGSSDVLVAYDSFEQFNTMGYLSDRGSGRAWLTISDNKLTRFYDKSCEIYINRVAPYDGDIFRIRVSEKISPSVRRRVVEPVRVSKGRINLSRDFVNENSRLDDKLVRFEFSLKRRSAIVSFTRTKASQVADLNSGNFIYTFSFSRNGSGMRTGGSKPTMDRIAQMTGFDFELLRYRGKSTMSENTRSKIHLLEEVCDGSCD